MEENEYIELETIINLALDKLYKKDLSLIRRKADERSIVFRFGLYFYKEILKSKFSIYDLDSEYNKDGIDPKRVKYEDGTRHSVRPDILLHKREKHSGNLLVLEFKKSKGCKRKDASSQRYDIKKIKALINPSGRFRYKYGATVLITQDRDAVVVKRIEYILQEQ